MPRNAVKAITPIAKTQPKTSILIARKHAPITVRAATSPPVPAPNVVEEFEEIVETRTVRRKRVQEAPQVPSQTTALAGESSVGFASRIATVIFLWIIAAFLIVAGVAAVAMGQALVGMLFVLVALFPLLSGASINNYGRSHA